MSSNVSSSGVSPVFVDRETNYSPVSEVDLNSDRISECSDTENVDPSYRYPSNRSEEMDDVSDGDGSNLASNSFSRIHQGSNLALTNASPTRLMGIEDPDLNRANVGGEEIHVEQHDLDVEGGAAVEDQGANEDVPLPGPSGQSDSSNEGNWLSYNELMLDSYPAKSKIIYMKAYKMFERYLKSKKQFVPNAAPSEIQILNYFYFLRHEKKLAPTTLWSTYSRVNACVKRLFGFSLKNFVRVSDVLKSYESGYKVKKASIFSPQEVPLSIKVIVFIYAKC